MACKTPMWKVEKIITDLIDGSLTNTQIADKYGVAKQTVSKYYKKNKDLIENTQIKAIEDVEDDIKQTQYEIYILALKDVLERLRGNKHKIKKETYKSGDTESVRITEDEVRVSDSLIAEILQTKGRFDVQVMEVTSELPKVEYIEYESEKELKNEELSEE